MKAPVKPINKCTEVASSVFGEIERMVSATQAGFEVTQNRVDPVKFWQILGLAATCDDGPMLAACIGYPGKTAQAIGSDYTTWREVYISPVDNRFARKTRNRRHFNIQRSAFGTERNSCYKWHFILGTTPSLAASQFTTEVSVIYLDITTQLVLSIPFDHRLHQLLLYQPSRGVAHAQLPFKIECRQAGLCLADQINSQEPNAQRQVGALEQGACDQGCLQPAALALEGLMFSSLEQVVIRVAAPWATEALRPTRGFQCVPALLIGAILRKECGQGQAWL